MPQAKNPAYGPGLKNEPVMAFKDTVQLQQFPENFYDDNQ